MRNRRSILPCGGALLLAAALLTLPAAPAASGSTRCFDDWSDAGPVVQREGLRSTRDLSAWARRSIKGRIVRVTLCKDGDRYIYRLLIKDRRGRISHKVVDARKPDGGH